MNVKNKKKFSSKKTKWERRQRTDIGRKNTWKQFMLFKCSE